MDRSDKQKQYLEKAGNPEVDEERTAEDDGGWMLVKYNPSLEVSAAIAEAEQTVSQGEKVHLLDEWVWVDREGREHFGPGETGFDRFELGG